MKREYYDMEVMLRFYNEKSGKDTKRCEFMDRKRMHQILDHVIKMTQSEANIRLAKEMKKYLDENPLEKTREKVLATKKRY